MLENLILHDRTYAHIFHATTEWLALGGGFWLFRAIRKRRGETASVQGGLWVLGFCLLGAGTGNKLVSMIQHPQVFTWLLNGDYQRFLIGAFSGQSVVGGLLGGWLGVEIGKKITHVQSRTGDDFVVPILIGLMVGRTGCFVAGLHDGTYGVHTTLPWAVDFGDGLRHPTQLYEWLMAGVALATFPVWRRWCAHEQGLAFRVLMVGYLLWRLCIDGLKPVPHAYAWGLSGIQWVCLISLVLILFTYRKKQA